MVDVSFVIATPPKSAIEQPIIGSISIRVRASCRSRSALTKASPCRSESYSSYLIGSAPAPILAQAMSPSKPRYRMPVLGFVLQSEAAHPTIGVVVESVEISLKRLIGVCWPSP